MSDINQAPEVPRVKRPYVRRQTPIREAEVRAEEATREPVREKRVRVRKGNANSLDLPREIVEEYRANGVDLQWVSESVNGQPVPHIRAQFEINGWRPLLGSDAPEVAAHFMPKGWQGEIAMGGQVLMERPLELTEEARAEEYREARAQLNAQVRQLASGQIDGVTMDTQHPSARANTRLTREVVRGMPIPKE